MENDKTKLIKYLQEFYRDTTTGKESVTSENIYETENSRELSYKGGYLTNYSNAPRYRFNVPKTKFETMIAIRKFLDSIPGVEGFCIIIGGIYDSNSSVKIFGDYARKCQAADIVIKDRYAMVEQFIESYNNFVSNH